MSTQALRNAATYCYSPHFSYRCAYWNLLVHPKQLVHNDTVTVRLKEEIILENGELEQWLRLGASSGWIFCRFRGDNLAVGWWLGNKEVRTNSRYTVDAKIGLNIKNICARC